MFKRKEKKVTVVWLGHNSRMTKLLKTPTTKDIEILELKFSFILHVAVNLPEVLLKLKELVCLHMICKLANTEASCYYNLTE